jgi:hypothetical protein
VTFLKLVIGDLRAEMMDVMETDIAVNHCRTLGSL